MATALDVAQREDRRLLRRAFDYLRDRTPICAVISSFTFVSAMVLGVF